MKLAKRIVALAIVLCTVAAMMIPGVSAASNDLKIEFKPGFESIGQQLANSLAWIKYGKHNASDENSVNYEQSLYSKFTSNGWRMYHDANGVPLVAGGTKTVCVQGNTGALHVAANKGTTGYVPVEITAPATGSYTLTVNHERSSDNKELVHGAYVVGLPASGKYTADTLPKTGSATVTTTGLTDFVTGDIGPTVATSTDTVNLEAGKQYLVVFYVSVPSKVASSSLYSTFAGFSLNYQGGSTGGSQSPNTGIADMQVWFALLTASCLGMAAMFVYKKKEA